MPNKQGPIHLKPTLLDPKYKNSSHAKSKVQSLISRVPKREYEGWLKRLSPGPMRRSTLDSLRKHFGLGGP